MTVTYSSSVSTSHPWTFIKLLFRWRGSVWKAVWQEYLVWLALYFACSGIYRFLLSDWQRKVFEALVKFINSRMGYIPLDLMLGFFVAGVLGRFWYLYNIIGWMDNIGLMTALYVRGTTERARQYRRNIIRYCQLTQVLVFRDLSMRCRKRFPTLDTVAAAGFMMPHEKANFDDIQYNYNKYFLPFNWAWALIYRAREEGFIESDFYVTVLSEEVKKFRTDLAWLCNYDWVPLPMIYPTIVCLAVHMYFLVCIVARQFVDAPGSKHVPQIDLVFPFMTTIQFVLYMGWLKVGEALLNPWGLDDDDFETNVLIDRNFAMGLKIVDEGYGKTPEMKKDKFWDDQWVPLYSVESAGERKYRNRAGSLAHIQLDPSIQQIRMVSRRGSSVKERVVPVQPEETTRRGSSMKEKWSEEDESILPLSSLLRRPSSLVGLALGRRSSLSTPNTPSRLPSFAVTPLDNIGEEDFKIAIESVNTAVKIGKEDVKRTFDRRNCE